MAIFRSRDNAYYKLIYKLLEKRIELKVLFPETLNFANFKYNIYLTLNSQSVHIAKEYPENGGTTVGYYSTQANNKVGTAYVGTDIPKRIYFVGNVCGMIFTKSFPQEFERVMGVSHCERLSGVT